MNDELKIVLKILDIDFYKLERHDIIIRKEFNIDKNTFKKLM